MRSDAANRGWRRNFYLGRSFTSGCHAGSAVAGVSPMRHTLDPKLDVVFKLLFADERNRRLLISLLTAVLEPAQPIVDVEVLNPITPKETVVDKGGAVLDVRARFLSSRWAGFLALGLASMKRREL